MAITVLIRVLGFSVSIFLGSLVVKYLNIGLRCYIVAKEERNKLTPTIGCIQRGIYTFLFCSSIPNRYELIALLFGLLAAQKVFSLTKITKSDKQPKDRLDLYKEISARINVYFISSFVSLFFGILGGLIINFLK